MKRVVVLTGAGMSAESGLDTFRDSDGLWNNHSIYEVATLEAWWTNKATVLDFYNHRRRELQKVSPNKAHLALFRLESYFQVKIITQNVDNLHERAGSNSVLHLHGELTQARAEDSFYPIIDIGYQDIELGDEDERGVQLRPHIVWFGEDVPEIITAEEICRTADILLVIGTSLQVYPAAGLIHAVPLNCEVILINPKVEEMEQRVRVINEKAGTAVPALVENMINDAISASH